MPQTPIPPANFNVNQRTQGGGLMAGVGFGHGGLYQYIPPDEHLVAGQLKKNIDLNSPLMRQAQQNAMEVAMARGAADTSYQAGAAQRATIDSMLPIASQDSETLTRVGQMNAQNAQDAAMLAAQMNASQREGNQISYDMTGENEADRMLQLQLQRERLAFEGEQAGYGREHGMSMGLFDLYGNLYQGQQNFSNQRQLGFDEFGFNRALAGDQFGYQRGLRGDDFLYNSSLARQNADLDMRQSYFNQMAGIGRGMQDFYQNIILGGMSNPEFMADPEGFFGFAQFATGQVPGPGSNFFRNMFGFGG